MKLLKLKCLRCDHIWIPRREQRPKICPICKRKNWDKPPGKPITKEIK